MAIPFWQPGELVQPGDLRRPTSAGAVTHTELANPSFEEGDTGWIAFGASENVITAIEEASPAFDGSWRARVRRTQPGAGTHSGLTNVRLLPVPPGGRVSAKAFFRCNDPASAATTSARLVIGWADPNREPIGHTYSHTGDVGNFLRGTQANGVWTGITVTGIAPLAAAFWSLDAQFWWFPVGDWLFDAVSSDYFVQEPPNRLIFRAVQTASGFTGHSEPDWPTQIGDTVHDNEVTWEAISPDNVTWEGRRILVSGGSEPTWPLSVNASVRDGSISWVLDPRRASDPRVPQTPLVAIAASKVFAGDGDIVAFSATTNPLDWTKPEDAGYLPFGLQTYGANPITALGLYRGNLVVSNSVGTQIWQVDPDPAGMALLDAIPIGCTFPKTMQPVGNDLALLTEVGIRNMGTVGAAVNLQAGYFGKPIDELVIEAVKTARNAGREPIATYWPAQGQYWVIFGNEAFVLTVNDGSDGRSWSRYVFPSEIDYAAVLGEELYLRSGDLVWRVDESADADDVHEENGEEIGEPFSMVLQWPHLDFGSLGQEKQLVAFDLVGSGEVSVSIGYDQRDSDFDPDGGAWTPLYEIGEADTLPGQPIPLPVAGPSFALRLEFTGGETREFIAANLYIADTRRG